MTDEELLSKAGITVTLKMPLTLHHALKVKCGQEDVTVSACIRKLVREYLGTPRPGVPEACPQCGRELIQPNANDPNGPPNPLVGCPPCALWFPLFEGTIWRGRTWGKTNWITVGEVAR